MGLIFGFFKMFNVFTNVYELAIMGTMFRFISKLPFINVYFGNLLVIFMDIIYNLDFQLMFNLKNEAGIREDLGQKFDEYIVPSLAINSAIIQVGAYGFTFLLHLCTSHLNSKVGRGL